MKNTKVLTKTFLGLLIATVGVVLFSMWNPKESLYEYLRMVPGLSFFAPYYFYYLKVNAACFILSGILSIFNNSFAILFQFLGSLMFALTYDNPFFAKTIELQVEKFIYLSCHIIIISTMLALGESETVSEETSETTKDESKKD